MLQGLWTYILFSFFFTFHHFLVLLLFFILFMFIFSSPFPLASFLPILSFLDFLLLFKSSLIPGLYFGAFVSRHCLKFLTSDLCISHSSIFQQIFLFPFFYPKTWKSKCNNKQYVLCKVLRDNCGESKYHEEERYKELF